jgi:hypothetical protein
MTEVKAILSALFFFVLFLLFHYLSHRTGGQLGTSLGRIIFAPLVRRRRRNVRKTEEQRQGSGLPPLENPNLE